MLVDVGPPDPAVDDDAEPGVVVEADPALPEGAEPAVEVGAEPDPCGLDETVVGKSLVKGVSATELPGRMGGWLGMATLGKTPVAL